MARVIKSGITTSERIIINDTDSQKAFDWKPVDWSKAMPHTAALEKDKQEEKGYKWETDFGKALDNIVEFLGGKPRRSEYGERQASEFVAKFGNYTLRNIDDSYTPYTSNRKGWYSGNELMSRLFNYLADKHDKKKKEQEDLVNSIVESLEESSSEEPKMEVFTPKPVNPPASPVRNNQSIISMLTKMPYFSQNMFSVYFMYNDERVDLNTLSSHKSSEAYKDIINGFGVRLYNFEIPQPKNQTYSVKVLDREIKKVSSSYEIQHKVDLTFEVDYMGMLIQHFQILSNGNPGPNADSNLIVNPTDSYYAVEMFPAAFGNRNKLKMVILYNDMRNVYYKEGQKTMHDQNGFIKNSLGQTIGDEKSYRAFVFDDVQFLGINKSLDFSRDTANEMKISTSFRFREVLEFDNNRIG